MNDINQNNELTETDIQKLIDNEVEESIHLEFKQADALGKSEPKKKEISKDVASFANSDGGRIVYGLTEINHKAASLSFIDGEEFTKEWLENVIQSNVQRKIADLKIIPIRFNNDIKKTIYVVRIPESYDAPHIAKDKKFYKRYNFQSVPMEEYEVRQVFNKRGLSKLIIKGCFLSENKTPNRGKVGFSSYVFSVLIENISNYLEANYKTIVVFKNIDDKIDISVPTNNNTNTIRGLGYAKISTTSKSIIFPNEVDECGEVFIDIPSQLCEKLLSKIILEVDLLYTNGNELQDIILDNVLDNINSTNLI